MANQTRGGDLMRDLQDGRTEYAPSAYLIETRELVSAELEELIDVGARIRPLLLGTERIGWVRGVHLAERKALKRWITNDHDFIQHLIRLGTTLTDAEVAEFNMVEIRSVCRVIQAMTESDLKLYSFVGPFVTTNLSEQLWYSQGQGIATSFDLGLNGAGACGEAIGARSDREPRGYPRGPCGAPEGVTGRSWAARMSLRRSRKAMRLPALPPRRVAFLNPMLPSQRAPATRVSPGIPRKPAQRRTQTCNPRAAFIRVAYFHGATEASILAMGSSLVGKCFDVPAA